MITLKPFNLATATSEEIWHDALQERLLQSFDSFSRIIPAPYSLHLANLIPLSDRRTRISVLVQDGVQALSYDFMISRKPGAPFNAQPLSPSFVPFGGKGADGYPLENTPEARHDFAMALLTNYRSDLEDLQSNPMTPRIRRSHVQPQSH